jgi:amino acid transporter
VFALQGFEQATHVAGEARDPQRNVPRAVIVSVAVGILLHLALEAAFIGALNPGDLLQGWDHPVKGWDHPVSKGDFGPYATLAHGLGKGWLANILYFDAFISPAATGLIFVGTSARLSYALGHAGYAPRVVSQISRRGVPYISIILAFVVGLIFFLSFPSWKDLVQLVTAATAIMYAFAPITLLALRKTDPHRVRLYRLRVAPVLAPLAFIAANEIIYWTSWASAQADAGRRRRLPDIRDLLLARPSVRATTAGSAIADLDPSLAHRPDRDLLPRAIRRNQAHPGMDRPGRSSGVQPPNLRPGGPPTPTRATNHRHHRR